MCNERPFMSINMQRNPLDGVVNYSHHVAGFWGGCTGNQCAQVWCSHQHMKIYSYPNILRDLERIVSQIREHWPKTRAIIRGDSGFCRGDIRPGPWRCFTI